MYDYLIVGAGSAGAVLAARLSEDPAVRVLVVEAGPPDTADNTHVPVLLASGDPTAKPTIRHNDYTEPETE